MHLILLPGNAPENELWARQMLDHLRPHFDTAHVFTYNHWRTGYPLIDIDQEIANLETYAASHIPYVIFAKSAGILVVTKALSAQKISPHKCIFVGVPLDWAKSNNFNIPKWIKSINVPTLIIQHLNDPLATFDQVQNISRSPHIKLHQLPGYDHCYHELATITQLSIGFIYHQQPVLQS
jgi:pimeloyl-ACP methyl ester carboxylesterase